MMQRVEKDIEFIVRDNVCVWQVTRTASKFTSPTCHELIAPEETIDRATQTGSEIRTAARNRYMVAAVGYC